MGDLSKNTTYQVKKEDFRLMIAGVKAYKLKYKLTDTTKVMIRKDGVKSTTNYILYPKFHEMYQRWNAYIREKGVAPAFIWINKPGSTVTPVPDVKPTFGTGYFVDPKRNPIDSKILSELVKLGITEIYYRARDYSSEDFDPNEIPVDHYSRLLEIKKMTDAVGLKLFAWGFMDDTQAFGKTKQVTAMGIHTLMDCETYNMADRIPQLKQMREESKGKTFIICAKMDGYDGNQRYDLLAPICDYIMPMAYTGDHNMTNMQLATFVNAYNIKYPGKIVPALETYKSDNDFTPKSSDDLNAEIKAVKPYCKGIALFRYGLSNFGKTTTATPTPAVGTVQTAIQNSIGYKFTTFTEFYNWVKKYADYSYYFDDQYTFQQAVNRKVTLLNCVDFAQVGAKLAKEMGYGATLYGVYCDSYGINHAIFLITGKEFANSTTTLNGQTVSGKWIDLAAAASESYDIGYHWCNHNRATKNPGWLPYE